MLKLKRYLKPYVALFLGAIILLRALLSFMIHAEMKNGPEETGTPPET